MNAYRITTAVIAAGLCSMAAPALAADKPGKSSLGKREFDNNCAVCHGSAGKGNGPLAGLIETRVPDLSVLAKKNAGVFPVQRTYELIDGTRMVKAHGTSEMPAWGQRYRIGAVEHFVDVPYDERLFVRTRILALIEYLSTLQQE